MNDSLLSMGKHSGIMSEFRRRYLKTDLLDRRLTTTITDAFEVRNASDYDDFYIISKADVEFQIQKAERFLCAVGEYLAGQGVQ